MVKILVMTQANQLSADLLALTERTKWHFDYVSTATQLVVALEQVSYAAVLWDLRVTNLDTTLATMTLIRPQYQGPILILGDQISAREHRKLAQARVDDVLRLPIDLGLWEALISQKLWVYEHVHLDHNILEQRATPTKNNDVIKVANWVIDLTKVQVTKDQHAISLTPKEFQLLAYLAQHQGQVLSREQLLTGVWGYDDLLTSSRIVDMHMAHLRDKLEDDDQQPQHLLTVRGFGYKLV